MADRGPSRILVPTDFSELATWALFQAGVRIPDIGDANLLDAQIFGQLTILNSTLRRVVHRDRDR